jgi:hypothetical protein
MASPAASQNTLDGRLVVGQVEPDAALAANLPY